MKTTKILLWIVGSKEKDKIISVLKKTHNNSRSVIKYFLEGCPKI